MSENPFKSRWAVDDPDFIKLRKKQWPFVKGFLSHYSAKEMKNIRQFFIKGDWPDGLLPKISYFLPWTPTKNAEELIELLIFLSNESRGDDYIDTVQYTAAFGGWSISTDSPVSFAFGNEELLAKVIIGETYSDRIELSTKISIRRNFSAQKFIDKYEDFILRFLVNVDPNFYSPVKYCLNYYLSCIHHLENKGEVVEHHENFAHIFSTAFNFVEGGQTGDKPPSSVAEFAQLFKERVTQDDAPESIKAVIKSLEPNCWIEYSRKIGLAKVFVFGNYRKANSLWGIPIPSVIRGCEHNVAFSAFWQAATNNELIAINTPIPELQQVNIGKLLSQGVVKELGYQSKKNVPAYRLTLWYEPNVRFASHGKAKFGMDMIFIIPKNGVITERSTSVIYYPRLSQYYEEWIPTTVLYLKERQVRRSIWELTHKHLLRYRDDWCNELVNTFMDYPVLELGYEIFSNYNESDLEHSISGPDTPPWEGKPLPELNLKEILNHVN